jgi:hypothetical protein
MPALQLKDGEPTAYGFACGYVSRKEHHNVRVTLWQEHGVYHIRRSDWRRDSMGAYGWETTTSLTDARTWFRQMVADVKRGKGVCAGS